MKRTYKSKFVFCTNVIWYHTRTRHFIDFCWRQLRRSRRTTIYRTALRQFRQNRNNIRYYYLSHQSHQQPRRNTHKTQPKAHHHQRRKRIFIHYRTKKQCRSLRKQIQSQSRRCHDPKLYPRRNRTSCPRSRIISQYWYRRSLQSRPKRKTKGYRNPKSNKSCLHPHNQQTIPNEKQLLDKKLKLKWFF